MCTKPNFHLYTLQGYQDPARKLLEMWESVFEEVNGNMI